MRCCSLDNWFPNSGTKDEPLKGDGTGQEQHVPTLWFGSQRNRNRVHATIFCLYLAAVGLVILLRRKPWENEEFQPPPFVESIFQSKTSEPTTSSSPTAFATDFPTQIPTTTTPTSAPITQEPTSFPETILLPAIADTYIHDGEFADTNFGNQDNIEVQSSAGEEGNNAHLLLQFEASDAVLPILNGFDDDNTYQQVILRLEHTESTTDGFHEISVTRLLIQQEENIESVTWNTFEEPSSNFLQTGPNFVVQPWEKAIVVDITSLIIDSSRRRRTRSLRRLLDNKSKNSRDLQPLQPYLYLMLQSVSSSVEQGSDITVIGSSFRSREYTNANSRPQILFNKTPWPIPPPPPPPPSPPPTMAPQLQTPPPFTSPPTTAQQTLAPQSPPPTTLTPTTSKAPTTSPTICEDYVADYLEPKFIDRVSFNTDLNQLPSGSVSYLLQNGTHATIRVTQLWSNGTIAWMAPYYLDRTHGTPFVCPPTTNIAKQQTLDYTLECFNNAEVVFRLYLSDDTLNRNDQNNTIMEYAPEICINQVADAYANVMDTDRFVLYIFQAHCDPPPIECATPTPV